MERGCERGGVGVREWGGGKPRACGSYAGVSKVRSRYFLIAFNISSLQAQFTVVLGKCGFALVLCKYCEHLQYIHGLQ